MRWFPLSIFALFVMAAFSPVHVFGADPDTSAAVISPKIEYTFVTHMGSEQASDPDALEIAKVWSYWDRAPAESLVEDFESRFGQKGIFRVTAKPGLQLLIVDGKMTPFLLGATLWEIRGIGGP